MDLKVSNSTMRLPGTQCKTAGSLKLVGHWLLWMWVITGWRHKHVICWNDWSVSEQRHMGLMWPSLCCLSRSIMLNTWEWPPACLTGKYCMQAVNNGFLAITIRRLVMQAGICWLNWSQCFTLVLLEFSGYKRVAGIFCFSQPIKKRQKKFAEKNFLPAVADNWHKRWM